MDSALDVRRLHFAFTITFHNNFIHAARKDGPQDDPFYPKRTTHVFPEPPSELAR
jgi:hypothetical protein